jgi:hypothetical protein
MGSEWVPSYYEKLIDDFEASLERRDTITNWSLTVFLGIIGFYFALLTQPSVSHLWRVALLLLSLALFMRFAVMDMYTYSFVKKWEYMKQRVESHWITNEPGLKELEADILALDHRGRTTASRWRMIRSLMRNGFLFIFSVVLVLLLYEMTGLGALTRTECFLIGATVFYLAFECAIFLTHPNLRQR